MRRKNGTIEFTTDDLEMWEKMKFLLGQKEKWIFYELGEIWVMDSRIVSRDRYGPWSVILFGPIHGPDIGPGSYSVWLSIRIFFDSWFGIWSGYL